MAAAEPTSPFDESLEESLNARITMLESQQGLFTQALKAALEGRWTGANSVEAYLYALNPTMQGTLEVDPPYVPGV
jgi:hypothetical protein